MFDKNKPNIIKMEPIKWKNKNFSAKNRIAKIVLNKGINDKNIPALFAPIIATAPAQQ